jgi:hypothetical protein
LLIRQLLLFLLAPVILVLFVLFVMPAFGFERMNAELQEVDLSSGKTRITRFVCYLPISRNEQETVISRSLPWKGAKPSRWVPVNLFAAGNRVSPHYAFHSTINQIERIEAAWSLSNFDTEEKAEFSKRLLQAWQNGGGDFEAQPIVEEIEKRSITRQE